MSRALAVRRGLDDPQSWATATAEFSGDLDRAHIRARQAGGYPSYADALTCLQAREHADKTQVRTVADTSLIPLLSRVSGPVLNT
jgi:hypothetical protein